MVCAQSLPFQRVALLFLTVGPIWHEELWKRWLKDVQYSLPLKPLQYANYTAVTTELRSKCNDPESHGAWQVLYSLYSHPKPDWKGYNAESIFHGTEVTDRVQTQWGQHSLTEAFRLMLRAALLDLGNRRFVLLSDTSIPLYPAGLLYLQLTTERRSRLNACTPPKENNVWHEKLGEYSALTPQEIRKSSQWVSLVRTAAELVASDTELARAFEHCRPGAQHGPNNPGWSSCISDEVYVPTLLSYRQLGSETTCCDSLHHIEWPWDTVGHPTAFGVDDITPSRLHGMRESYKCKVDAAISSAPFNMVRLQPADWASASALEALIKRHQQPKPPRFALLAGCCPLFARKFGNDTAEALLAAFAGNWEGLYDMRTDTTVPNS